MPAAIRRRPEERKARAGRHSHPAQLRIRPPRASTSIPHASSAGLRRLQAARVQFGHASHAVLCREAGRLVSRSRKGEESGSGKPPGRKPHMCFAALPQRLQRPRCAPAAARSSVLHAHSAARASCAGVSFAGASPGRHAQAVILSRPHPCEPPPPNSPPSERGPPSVPKGSLSRPPKVGGIPCAARTRPEVSASRSSGRAWPRAWPASGLPGSTMPMRTRGSPLPARCDAPWWPPR